MSEKNDYLGTPDEEWDRLHRIPSRETPSQEEFFARDAKETPEQQVLFDRLSEIVGDPQFAAGPMAGIIMQVGLWRSIESGELTPTQGSQLGNLRSKSLDEHLLRSLGPEKFREMKEQRAERLRQYRTPERD